MDRQMTQQLHFGGGFAPKQGPQAHEQLEGEAPQRRTKKEVGCTCWAASLLASRHLHARPF